MPTISKIELTPLKLENLQPAPTGSRYEIADALVSGLRVRVSEEAVEIGRARGKAAQVVFLLYARFPPSTNPSRRTIGTYGRGTGAMSLQRAREVAAEWKQLIKQGVDPAELVRQEEREKAQQAAEAERKRLEEEEALRNRQTVKDILDQYEREKLSQLSTGAATRRGLDGKEGLLRDFLDQDLASLSRTDIAQAVKAKAKVAPTSANRTLAYAKAFFNWCIDEQLLEVSPAERVKKPSRENTRDRFHTVAELREIWPAMGTLGYPFGPMFQLLTLVPMRREEIAAMRLKELDLGNDQAPDDAVWRLPADRTKKRNALRVPLSAQARAILKAAIADPMRPKDAEHIFTTTGKTSSSGFSKAKARLDAEIFDRRKKAAAERGDDAEAMEHWILHDLRTTFNTIACDDLDIDANVADRILNHMATGTTSKVMRTYNRSELFSQRKRALAQWAQYIDREVIKSAAALDESD